jgi:hypothetical protein
MIDVENGRRVSWRPFPLIGSWTPVIDDFPGLDLRSTQELISGPEGTTEMTIENVKELVRSKCRTWGWTYR